MDGLVTRLDPRHLDYRVVWLCTSIPVWLLTLSMVYRHMEKILINLPGIAKLSRTVLNTAYVIAVTAVSLLPTFSMELEVLGTPRNF